MTIQKTPKGLYQAHYKHFKATGYTFTQAIVNLLILIDYPY